MSICPEKERFYEVQRESIKSRSMLPSNTLRYIEALEAIAKSAFTVWSTSPQSQATDTLYDALSVVDFMGEEG